MADSTVGAASCREPRFGPAPVAARCRSHGRCCKAAGAWRCKSALAGLLLAAAVAVPAAPAPELPPHAPRPGGIAVLDLGDGEARPAVRFDGDPVLTLAADGRWFAVVGIPLDQPVGNATVTVDGGDAASLEFEVIAGDYREQHLTVEPTYVNPGPEALERIGRERPLIAGALNRFSETAPATLRLAPPVPGRRSDSFGARRFFNDEPRSPHRGMDLSGASGTPVTAPLAGTVVLAGDFHFTGNTVILDHGQGLVTLYAHLSEIAVAEAQAVDTGDRLGLIGATGRVTGAHLHFATYLNGTPVDPALLLQAP
ncbi:MAG: peptidoglycan DD-metalloendopeptidase family protein [Woeseiaceae bacterium]|nr:peptidoglycan DD-metalloendopeptidase family protein [Woeseiaceae bacterium]